MNLPSPVAAAARVGVLIAALAFLTASPAASSHIVISQFYVAGGISGAVYKNDYVELFNRSAAPVDITGWSIHSWNPFLFESFKIADLSGTIGPGRYFLVQFNGSATGDGADLPTPDAIGAGGLQAYVGGVSLVTGSAQFFCQQVDRAVDGVGYGSSRCAEGTPMPGLSVDTAALRGGVGCVDTDDNLADFSLGPPNPRNSASPPHLCSVVGVTRPVPQLTTRLDPPRPDPSATLTEFAFVLARDGPVRLQVFDLKGRRVHTLVDGFRPAGDHRVSWDGSREGVAAAPAGVYFVLFEAPGESARDTRRFVRVR